jgi:hypothetical protein
MAENGLAGLQAWLQDRVIAGTWQTTGDADTEVVSSAILSAEERVSVYAQSYVRRLAECLRTEFPVLRSLIGDQVFDLFAGGYLSTRPPASYSLYDLGAGFPDYLEATRPYPRSGPGTMEALPASLTRLERACAVAERASGVEDANGPPLDPLALMAGPDARLSTPPSLVLLRLDFDFTATFASPRDGRRPPLPEPSETLVAVARAQYRVRLHNLEPWAFAWLEALGTAGDLNAANEAARRAADDQDVLARVLTWLPSAAAAGFILSAKT